MTLASDDIKGLIETATGLTFGTDLFISRMPSDPVECVCMYDYDAGVPDDTLDGHTHLNSSIQFIIRSATFTSANTYAWQIIDALHLVANQTLNGTKYIWIKALGDPVPLRDQNSSQKEFIILSINFSIKRIKS